MTLRADAISVRPGKRTVLHDVSLTVRPGERVALVGANGAGKSTLLRCLAGLLPPSAGRVMIDDDSLDRLSRRQASRRIAWLDQDALVPADRTALEVALLGRAPWLGRWGWPGQADVDIAHAALDALGVGDLAERPAGALSGGERQRVALASALAQQTPWLLLDEPTSAQDFDGTARLLDVLDGVVAEGRAVIVAMHDLTVACRSFDRLVLVHQGTITADGAPLEVAGSEAARDAWGERFAVHQVDGAPVVVLRREAAP